MRLSLFLLALIFACHPTTTPKTATNPTQNKNTPTTAATTSAAPLPRVSATLIIKIGEEGTSGAVGTVIREALTEAGCTVLSPEEAEAKWKAQVIEKLNAGDINAASNAAFTSMADALVIGEASLDGSLTIKLKRIDPSSGAELWAAQETRPDAAKLPDEPKALSREVARQLLENLVKQPPIKAEALSTTLFLQGSAKPLSFKEIEEFRKALLAAVKEISAASFTESIEGTALLQIETKQDAASLASLLDGQKIGSYRLTVTKATKDGLFIVLK